MKPEEAMNIVRQVVEQVPLKMADNTTLRQAMAVLEALVKREQADATE